MWYTISTKLNFHLDIWNQYWNWLMISKFQNLQLLLILRVYKFTPIIKVFILAWYLIYNFLNLLKLSWQYILQDFRYINLSDLITNTIHKNLQPNSYFTWMIAYKVWKLITCKAFWKTKCMHLRTFHFPKCSCLFFFMWYSKSACWVSWEHIKNLMALWHTWPKALSQLNPPQLHLMWALIPIKAYGWKITLQLLWGKH